MKVGFSAIDIEATGHYSLQNISGVGTHTTSAQLTQDEQTALDAKFVSAFIHAHKLA